MVVAAGLYHWVFLKGAREGWPIVGSLVRLVVKDEFAAVSYTHLTLPTIYSV